MYISLMQSNKLGRLYGTDKISFNVAMKLVSTNDIASTLKMHSYS